MTDAELIVVAATSLAASGHQISATASIGIYIADFAVVSAHLAIEVDGATHSSDEERIYDEARETYLRRRGWRVLRFQNHDVYKRLNDVLDFIASQLPPPSGSRQTPPPVNGGENRRRVGIVSTAGI